jgi:hypothetical protein
MEDYEVSELLTFIAAFDRRIVGRADVLAWHSLPSIAGADLATAKQAVILFFDQEPPDRGPAPYLDPKEFRKYLRMARDRAEIEEARERARRPQIMPGKDAYAPPKNFRQMIEDAVKNFARMP